MVNKSKIDTQETKKRRFAIGEPPKFLKTTNIDYNRLKPIVILAFL